MHDVLVCVVCDHWEVQYQCHPVAIDEEQEGQEGVDSSLGYDVCVEPVAKVYRIDVVTRSVLAAALTHGIMMRSGSLRGNAHPKRIMQGRSGDIPFQVAVHDRKEHLQKQVHCIKQDGKQE